MEFASNPSYWADMVTDSDGESEEGDIVAMSSGRMIDGKPLASQDELVEALRRVYDPEIPVNIYDLGLIYRLAQDEAGNVAINMSLTSPGCPVAGTLPQMVADTAASVDGVNEVVVRLVWDPPWSPERMSEDARLALGMY